MQNDFIEIGFIRKTNGFKGEVIVAVHNGNTEDLNDCQFLFLEMDGSIVPFFVEHFSDESGKAVVKFEDVNSHESAAALVSRKVFLPAAEFVEHAASNDYSELIGYSVIDKEKGMLGIVKSVSEMPGQFILSFEYSGAEILLPLHEKTLLKVIKKKKELHVILPDGLLEVYLSK